jgi:hypothetical protein
MKKRLYQWKGKTRKVRREKEYNSKEERAAKMIRAGKLVNLKGAARTMLIGSYTFFSGRVLWWSFAASNF